MKLFNLRPRMPKASREIWALAHFPFCPCFPCCYTARFVILILFFLRIHPSKCLESVGFVMLEPTKRWCGTGGQVKGGGRLTAANQQHCYFDSQQLPSLFLCITVSLSVSVCLCVCRRDKQTGSSLLWDWCLYQTIITTLAVFSVSLKFDTV